MYLQIQQKNNPKKRKNTRLIDKRYVVDYSKLLGSGSYGNVYEAQQKKLPQLKLACKILSKDLLDKKLQQAPLSQNRQQLHSYIIKRINSQIEISQKLSHPNIVQFIYCSSTQNNIYIFMQNCTQGNLKQFIKLKGNLPQSYALSIMKDIVEAACFLYQYDISHRDIKATNVLLKQGRAKLADFGFAKIMLNKDHKDFGTRVGTLNYMAPQLMFQQKPEYSIRCDVWSIGVLFYQILYGYLPWNALQDMQSFRLTLRKPIQFSKHVDISNKMKNLISNMLIFNDQDRISINNVKLELIQIADSFQIVNQ